MDPELFRVGDHSVPTHGFFAALGVLVAIGTVVVEARQRRMLHDGVWATLAGALVGGAVGARLSGLLPAIGAGAVDLRSLWLEGARSILGGLTGAYVGGLLAKRLVGYRVRTGDLFAPALAIGMAVGRIGCLLTEPPGRPTSLPWGIHGDPATPDCPGCLAGVAMHPSFLYEIAFQVAAFVALIWLKRRISEPGLLLTVYLAAYAAFRFLVEFTRANDIGPLGLTRPQWFILVCLPVLLWRLSTHLRAGHFHFTTSPHPRTVSDATGSPAKPAQSTRGTTP